MPHSDISATTAAFATLRKPEINRRGFASPALMCLPFRPRDNNYYKYGFQICSLAGQTLSASGRGSGDIPIVELCRHAGIFPA